MSQCEYNEWCDEAEIGLHCLKLSLQANFESRVGDNFGLTSPLFTPRLCGFGLLQAFHSSWTLPMSHCEYNEWCDEAEIGLHWPKLSLQADF